MRIFPCIETVLKGCMLERRVNKKNFMQTQRSDPRLLRLQPTNPFHEVIAPWALYAQVLSDQPNGWRFVEKDSVTDLQFNTHQ